MYIVLLLERCVRAVKDVDTVWQNTTYNALVYLDVCLHMSLCVLLR